jgi:hypothetical protein
MMTDINPIDAAINAPGGKLAELLLDRLWKRKPIGGSGLPDDVRPFFDDLVGGTGVSNEHASVILASRLVSLHAVDAEWSRKHIIGRMRIGQDPLAPALWSGYLWSPRYSLALLHDLKSTLLEAIPRSADLHAAHREQLFSLFAEITVADVSAFMELELREAFASMSGGGLAECAKHFRRKLEAAVDKAPVLWRGTIGPIFDKYWPKTRRVVTSETSGSLARCYSLPEKLSRKPCKLSIRTIFSSELMQVG